MFDVPMNSTGCMSLGDIGSTGLRSSAASSPTPQPQPQAAPIQQQYTPPQQVKQRAPATGVILKKGQKTNLAGAGGAPLTSISVRLGWDLINESCDLDTSAFMLGADGKVIGDSWFVFYGCLQSPDGSILHHGDSDGSSTGDDEVIDINLNQVSLNVAKIAFVVTINEALTNGQNFSMVQNAYVRVVDNSTGSELVRFQLSEYYSNVCSMVVGELYRHNGQWKFNAVGNGLAQDLEGLCMTYGVNVIG